jgi:uncharacterized protein (UPF0332 family)
MNPEDIRVLVQARIGQAVESLEDAQTLLEAGRSGRSIVNRSYYSMFHGALALLQTINRIPRRHQSVVSLFDREFAHKSLLTREFSADLHRIFEARQQDDYQKLEPVGLDEATAAIDAAERFLQAVREYLTRAGYLLHE